ncbi:hypothetical protein BH11MYX4_BH11MYX4_07250 [soil metagenome]
MLTVCAGDASAEAGPAPDASPLKRFAIEINPLAVGIGRYSLQAEAVVAKHHAITANPFFVHLPMRYELAAIDGGTLTGFGGELGYRFYSGSGGPEGFFIGPSAIFAAYSNEGGGPGTEPFTTFGAAADIGGQLMLGPGVVLGAGLGVQYLRPSTGYGGACSGGCAYSAADLDASSRRIVEGGVSPRILLAMGYAF